MASIEQKEGPMNPLVDSMLTDLYQITMAYAYWKAKTQDHESVFEVFFRVNPFQGEFTIFAGLEEVLRYISTFKFKTEDVDALRAKFPAWDPAFWKWLGGIDASAVKIFAVPEGSLVFPRIPLIRVEGPLAICQLFETTVLVLVNYASLVTTNAARHRLAAGPKASLLEFGLRRAQGPDGAMSASRYCYIGGFDGTSNVRAGLKFGMDIRGTHAHAFVSSFSSISDLPTRMLRTAEGHEVDFVSIATAFRSKIEKNGSNEGEFTAFVAYAQAFPSSFLALIDTYDSLTSGVINFLAVALALQQCGYKPIGIRLDSGDLAYLSKECRSLFRQISEQFQVPFEHLTIVASNELSEEVIHSLNEQGHAIDSFGVGTNLVTCRTQPALGCVYKLVEINGKPRMKISQDAAKVTIPGRKAAYRLFNSQDEPVVDLLVSAAMPAPRAQERILCRHPFDATKRVFVTPSKVESLHCCVWSLGAMTAPHPSLQDVRQRVRDQLAHMRADHLRRMNPTPYKVSVSSELYTFLHDLWLAETPIRELS